MIPKATVQAIIRKALNDRGVGYDPKMTMSAAFATPKAMTTFLKTVAAAQAANSPPATLKVGSLDIGQRMNDVEADFEDYVYLSLPVTP